MNSTTYHKFLIFKTWTWSIFRFNRAVIHRFLRRLGLPVFHLRRVHTRKRLAKRRLDQTVYMVRKDLSFRKIKHQNHKEDVGVVLAMVTLSCRKSLVLLLTFNLIFIFSSNVLGQDRCTYSYKFENDNEVPIDDTLPGAKIDNDGWGIQNYGGRSYFASRTSALCTFKIELEGPFRYDFNWGLKVNKSARGLFLFYEDAKKPISCTRDDKVGPNYVTGPEKHTLKWVVSRSISEDYIGFIDNLTIKLGNCQEPVPLIRPEEPMGPNEGDTNKKYAFFAGSEGNSRDGIEYIFDWGDGNVSEPASGEPVMSEHSWAQSGLYEVKVKSLMGGRQSDWSKSSNIKIYTSMNITSGVDLSSIINSIENYTKIELQGDIYSGHFILENKHDITIRSKIDTKIVSDDCRDFIIGLDNLNNFSMNGLVVQNNCSVCTIYLRKCRDCIISNNFVDLINNNRGIGLYDAEGYNNSIKNNVIKLNITRNCTQNGNCIAFMFNNTDRVSIECNEIRGPTQLYNYYFTGTNIKTMKVRLSNHGYISVNRCGVHLENGQNGTWLYENGSSCRGIGYEVCQ